MTPAAIMKRSALLLLVAYGLAGLGLACVTAHTPEGERELTRDAIHWRLVQCMHRADEEAARHGRNAMAEVFCARDAERDCRAARLEPLCAEWQAGGT